MRKKLPDYEIPTRAKRRETKKRPRMNMHGTSLRRTAAHAAGAIIKLKK